MIPVILGIVGGAVAVEVIRYLSSALFSRPWRTLPSRGESLAFLKSYKPQKEAVSHLRILLYGPIGAGKSSFVNSADSALRGQVAVRAGVDAIMSGSSYTKQYKTYKIRKEDGSFYSFVFNDIMGIEKTQDRGVNVDDLKLALQGHMKDGYKLNYVSPLTRNDEFYNASPSLDDKVHVLVCVIPADQESLLTKEVLEMLRQVREAASELDIPQMVILTKVDQACPEVKRNNNNIYKSKKLEEQAEKLSKNLGIPPNCIFLVKNYESETKTSDKISVPILAALRKMVDYGDDYLNDL